MKKELLFCDVCGSQFTDAYWDCQPSDVTLVMGGPGNNDGKVVFTHTCYTCRKGIRQAVDDYVATRQPKPVAALTL
jgi:hypothetical protein